MWIGKVFKAIGKFYEDHPMAGIITGTAIGGLAGLGATGSAHLLNKSFSKMTGGDLSALAAAQSAKEAFTYMNQAKGAMKITQKTAVDTINLASRFVEK